MDVEGGTLASMLVGGGAPADESLAGMLIEGGAEKKWGLIHAIIVVLIVFLIIMWVKSKFFEKYAGIIEWRERGTDPTTLVPTTACPKLARIGGIITRIDTKTGADILRLFDDLHAQGRTLILVTHEATVAERATWVLRLKDGLVEDVSRGGKHQREVTTGP